MFFEYEEYIYPEWDFTNNQLKFLYNLIKHCYLMQYKNIDETLINIEVNKNEEWVKQYKEIKGYKTIQRLIDKINIDDFKTYYATMKKYNLFRELNRKGFPIIEKWDKIKDMEPEDIYRYFDYGLAKTFSHYQGVADSVILGSNMSQVFEQWLVEPDIGIDIPYYITSNLIRGWRKGKLNGLGLHSGVGKSRIMCKTIHDIGLRQQIPILLIVNEQDIEEWNSMILTSVVNNYFVKNKKYINETNIVTGELTKEEIAICRDASIWIENNSKIHFQEAQIYDYNSLKRILKTHKLKGCNFFVYDTFKPFRNKDIKGATWEAFVQTSEMLKQLCGNKKKGGLDLGGWVTFQLTDDTIFDKVLSSNSIASGKQIKHNFDLMSMYRPLTYKEKEKIRMKVLQPDNPFNGIIQNLDISKDYYIGFIDKNRGGIDKSKIIMEGNKGCLIFNELGFAVFSNKEDEESIENRKQ